MQAANVASANLVVANFAFANLAFAKVAVAKFAMGCVDSATVVCENVVFATVSLILPSSQLLVSCLLRLLARVGHVHFGS